MPVLKYWDGTQYVPLLSGAGGPDEVTIAAAQPSPVTDLWVDPNAPGGTTAEYVLKSGDKMTGDLGWSLGGLDRSIGMRNASNGSPGLRVLQSADGTLGPIGVMDPNLPEHAATRNWVETYVSERAAMVPATGYADHMYGLHATKIVGGLVNLEGQFRVTTTFTSDGFSRQLGTIPAGFRPTITAATAPGILVYGSPMTGGTVCVVVAQADGQLRWVIASGVVVTAGTATYVSVNLTYRLGV